MLNLVKAVKSYALDHYDSGWDVVVETMTDRDILDYIARAEQGIGIPMDNLTDIVNAFEAWPGPVAVWLHQLRETAWGGPDASPY